MSKDRRPNQLYGLLQSRHSAEWGCRRVLGAAELLLKRQPGL